MNPQNWMVGGGQIAAGLETIQPCHDVVFFFLQFGPSNGPIMGIDEK